ncbi:MAG: CPXCG motif-containing cysteine-rich protein [Nevskiaceae bacterium]
MALIEDYAAQCPYCGEPIVLELDLSAGAASGASAGGFLDMTPASQVYVEDCAVCCQPLRVVLQVAADGSHVVDIAKEND